MFARTLLKVVSNLLSILVEYKTFLECKIFFLYLKKELRTGDIKELNS